MSPIDEARELLKKISTASSSFGFDMEQFKEDEVAFRFKAVKGMLIMAGNDVSRMIDIWEKEERSTQ